MQGIAASGSGPAGDVRTPVVDGLMTVGLWCVDGLVETWPRDHAPAASDLHVPLPGSEARCQLGVTGARDNRARERLETDAAAIARISRLEGDLDLVTEQLVQRQDELLALYELARASRSTLDVQETLSDAGSRRRPPACMPPPGFSSSSPEQIAQAVLTAVAIFQSGRPPDDDQTLLIVQGMAVAAEP